ncbi:MAG: tocopherol cyclase family protein, partial [Eubacteriales bacterium]
MIPGIQMDGAGDKSAFIQVITPQASWQFIFPFHSFSASKKGFSVSIDRNFFGENGVILDISQNGVVLKGSLVYGDFTPIAYNIMGPFACLPFMECNHAVHSLYHTVHGSMQLESRLIDFSGGRGYIEQDWGHSFPKKYIWLQANDFSAQKASLFLSIAQIPVLGLTFNGCICVFYCNQTEYRLATYLGVQILEWNQSCILLKQGRYTLHVAIEQNTGQPLFAPSGGRLIRTIHESPSCRLHVVFLKNGRRIFEETSA